MSGNSPACSPRLDEAEAAQDELCGRTTDGAAVAGRPAFLGLWRELYGVHAGGSCYRLRRMSDDHAWVTLVECNDVGELHALRAALEAHGVPCRTEGENTHGIMGAIHGSMVRSRVLVPRRGLMVARKLAEDIVGPFDEPSPPSATDDDDVDESPFRRQAEAAVEGEDDEPTPPPAMRPKSYSRLVLIAFMVVAPLFGLSHVYAGRNARAGVLLLLTVVALPQALFGAAWAWWMLVGIWLADILGGAVAIAEHNRELARAGATPARPVEHAARA